MKAIADTLFIQPSDREMLLDPALARALRVIPGDHLYLLHVDGGLVATPMPPATWGRLLRICFMLQPTPGAIHGLLCILRTLELRPFTLEDAQGAQAGIDLKEVSLLPTATFVIEIPQDTPRRSHAAKLHALLEGVLRSHVEESASHPQPTGEAVAELQRCISHFPTLFTESPDDCRFDVEVARRIRVEWISPMEPLNRLRDAELQGDAEEVQVSQKEVRPAWRRPSYRGLSISLPRSLRRKIFGRPGSAPDGRSNDHRVLALPYADTDERVGRWHLVDLTRHAAARFSLRVQSPEAMHLWWKWAFGCIREQPSETTEVLSIPAGNVLSATTSGSDSRNASLLTLTCTFPMASPEPGTVDPKDLAAMLRCFRHLHLACRARASWGSPRLEELASLTQLGDDASLEDVEIVTRFRHGVATGCGSRFGDNPYTFTRPLDSKDYTATYGEGGPQGRIAEEIASEVLRDDWQNVALIGAHRSGKTTVLRLIHDRLQDEERCTPVLIDASVIPPQQLLLKVAEKLNPQSAVARSFRRYARALGQVLVSTDVSFKTPLAEVDLSFDKEEEKDAAGLFETLLQGREEGREHRVLQASLELISKELKNDTERPILVVMVDELGQSTWGGERSLPFWRHVIESSEFRNIRWIFSTARPISQETGYSPISNVLKEYNLGPLPIEQARLLVDKMSSHAAGGSSAASSGDPATLAATDSAIALDESIELICWLTDCLPYLLQVVCFYLHDSATKYFVPVVTKGLTRSVVENVVLPQISGYIGTIWRQLTEETRSFVVGTLPDSQEDVFELFASQRRRRTFASGPDGFLFTGAPPDAIKELQRSGLTGNFENWPVAPIVALWLLSAAEAGVRWSEGGKTGPS